MKIESARQRKRAGAGKTAAASALFLAALLLSLILLPFLALAYDFSGRVEKVSEPNSMWVNVTQNGTYSLQSVVEVLLNKPLEGLAYFKGKDLQFEIQGHDLLGRPVCEAYLGGTNIREAYYCIIYPIECSYRRGAPAWGCDPIYRYDYPRLLPYDRRGYCTSSGNCCPGGYHCSYDYPWLSFV